MTEKLIVYQCYTQERNVSPCTAGDTGEKMDAKWIEAEMLGEYTEADHGGAPYGEA